MAFTTHPAERRLEATSFENPVDGPTHALLARSLTDVPGQRLGWAVGLASLVLALSAGAFAGGIATGLRLFRFPGDVAMRLQLDHGVIMTCFAVLPALLSTFGAARLPRQLRGPGLAAPAVAAGGVAAMAIGFLCLAVMPARTDIAVILWSVGVTLQAASTLATVANMRSPDLRLSDVSPFVWAQVAAHGLVAMLAPMLAAGMTRALLRGADPALVVRAFEAPLNAVALIAACGIVSLVVADARRPARSETRGTGVAFAVMAAGVVVWMHGALRGHALSGVWLEEIFLMPAGVALAGLWIAGLWRAHVAPRPALFWA
ncbi:hypothetical protein HUK82_07205, partial [Ameyamaea chiangmaiensis]|nr:hypothetical protein [Ameyamaea chiangmaiensis]